MRVTGYVQGYGDEGQVLVSVFGPTTTDDEVLGAITAPPLVALGVTGHNEDGVQTQVAVFFDAGTLNQLLEQLQRARTMLDGPLEQETGEAENVGVYACNRCEIIFTDAEPQGHLTPEQNNGVFYCPQSANVPD